jgi:hypothetical protein
MQRPPNFVMFLQQSTTAELCLLQIVNISDIDQLAEWIKQGKAVIVSDGSYKNAIGTVTVIIEGPNGSGRLTFQASAPGLGSEINAFKSELTGIMAGVLMTVKIVEFYNISSGAITLACDSLSALQQCETDTGHIHHNKSCYDLISAIRFLRHRSPLMWTFKYVEEYQDDTMALDKLDRWARLNVEVDALAKAHGPIAAAQQRHFIVPFEPWSLWYAG